MTFPIEALQQHIAIVGKTGSGKTYTAKGLVEGLLAAKRRVCILDPTGAWYGLRSSADGKRAGFPVAVFGGAHGDVPIAEQSGATLAKILAEKNLPAIIDLSELLIGQRHRFVTDFAEAIYRENKTPLHLVIDEADEFIPQNPLPETKRLLHHIDRIIRRGRIRGFRVMMITQRPAVIHKNALTQANTLVVMRLTAPQDRKAIQAWIDGNGDAAAGRRVLDSLAGLQRGEGWVWAPELGTLEREQFPSIKTFDSSRTPGDDERVPEPSKLADVDIGEIHASFAQVEQEAKSLKDALAEVAKLKRELGTAQRGTSGISKDDVERCVKLAVHAAVKERDRVIRELHAQISRAHKQIAAAARDLEVSTMVQPIPPGSQVAEPTARDTGPERAVPLARNTGAARPAAAVASAAGITGPEQRILDGIAWMSDIGVQQPNQTAVAFLASYSSAENGAYKNARGSLRQRGFVEYLEGGRIALTAEGRERANFPSAGATEADLHHCVLNKLPGPECRILEPLLAVWPEGFTNDSLAVNAKYSDANNGAYKNARGRLRSFGLVEYRDGGVRACDFLFPERQS